MVEQFNKIYNRISEKQHHLIGLSILRITIGLHLLWQLILSNPIKNDLWMSIYLNPDVPLLHNEIYLNIFYYSGIIIMLIYTLGYGPIFFKVIVYLYVYTLYKASPFLGDGGTNILIIVLFYMIFTNNSGRFTIFSNKLRTKDIPVFTHNIFLALIIIQTCILYFFAGFFKLQGDMWIHGTALYYILSLDSFTMIPTSFISDYIISSPMLLTFGAYSAIFTQFLFPFLIVNKYTRYLVLLGSIGFHLSIIFLMGLVQFGAIMIALDLVFVKDKEYLFAFSFIKDKVLKFRLKPNLKRNQLS